MTPEQRQAALEAIASEVSGCTRCPLSVGRTHAVPGEGSSETEVVFVGEGPGFNEDQQGRPFVGAAGGLLNDLLKAIGWRRSDVFITNVVKCRPPSNRDPEPAEIAACAPYLQRQLEVLDPAIVVTLGRHSLQTFMPGARIGQSHGTIQPVNPQTGARDAAVLPMYHPAAALRQHSLRETMLEDMARLPQALLDSRARRQGAGSTQEPTNQASAITQSEPAPNVPPERATHVPPEPAPIVPPQPPSEVTPGPVVPSSSVGHPRSEPLAVSVAAGTSTALIGDPTPENQMELF